VRTVAPSATATVAGRTPDVDPGAPDVGRRRPSLPSREAWLTALALFALAVAVRAVAASTITFPGPQNSAYYFGVARNLVEGRGLVSDALWSFQTPPLVLPRPAFEVWLPLSSFLAAIPMALFGPSFQAGQVAAVLVGSLVPVLAWRIAADVAGDLDLPIGRARVLAVGTGIAAAVYGPLVTHSALTDSTMPFGVLALGACLVMVRLLRDPRGARALDRRLVTLGALLGLAALARNEALWVAVAWAALAWWDGREWLDRTARIRRIVVPGAIAIAVFAPWAVRDWLVFGTPLPGQAAANALSVTGFDIFAWRDPPTLARYLVQGPSAIFAAHIDGLLHNLVAVLLVPAIPAGPIGLAALPWAGRARSLRPLLIVALVTFATATLFFPVATQWGTFLHSATPVHVLLLVSCVVALDAGFAALARRMRWERPVTWLATAVVAVVALPVTVVSVASLGTVSHDAAQRYEALAARLDPFPPAGPVIADSPIWIAEAWRVPALALPDEEPASVLDLARHFGARLVVISGGEHGRWPAVLASGAAEAACFVPVDLTDPGGIGPPSDVLDGTRVYEITCR
jgi:hypothetical protein